MNSSVQWNNRITFVGVLINIFGMALPFIFAPQWYLDYFQLPGGGGSIIWMRQAGLLLLSVSLLYLPGGKDPFRYTWNAYAAVCVRFLIGSYWLFLVFVEDRTRAFIKFGVLDVTYSILNGFFLWKALKSRPTE